MCYNFSYDKRYKDVSSCVFIRIKNSCFYDLSELFILINQQSEMVAYRLEKKLQTMYVIRGCISHPFIAATKIPD